MREILFRGKRICNGKMMFGSLFCCNDGDCYIVADDFHRSHYRVEPETVGQFTGLTDKNGTKIFEGDIVDASGEWWNAAGPAGHDSPIIAVEWDDELCGFAPFAVYDCDCGVYISSRGVEVIGNIYDNPELLEVCNGHFDSN